MATSYEATALASGATRTVHAVCSHDCPDSCGVLVTVDQVTGRAVKIEGDPSHPVTRGFLCGKVAKYLDRVYSPDRLLYPMRRKSGAPKGPAGYGAVRGRTTDNFRLSAGRSAVQSKIQIRCIATIRNTPLRTVVEMFRLTGATRQPYRPPAVLNYARR